MQSLHKLGLKVNAGKCTFLIDEVILPTLVAADVPAKIKWYSLYQAYRTSELRSFSNKFTLFEKERLYY